MRRIKRSEKLDVRMTREVRAEIEAAADEVGNSLSSIVHTILVDWAAQRIQARGGKLAGER